MSVRAALREPFDHRTQDAYGLFHTASVSVTAVRERIKTLVRREASRMPESNLPRHTMNPTETGVMRLLTNTGDRVQFCMAGATVDSRERYQSLLFEHYKRLYKSGLVQDPRKQDIHVLEDYAKAWVLSGETIQMAGIPGLRRFGVIRELEQPQEAEETPQQKTGIGGLLDRYGVPIAGGLVLLSLHRLLSRAKNLAGGSWQR